MIKRILKYSLVFVFFVGLPAFVLQAQEQKKPNWQERWRAMVNNKVNPPYFVRNELPPFISELIARVLPGVDLYEIHDRSTGESYPRIFVYNDTVFNNFYAISKYNTLISKIEKSKGQGILTWASQDDLLKCFGYYCVLLKHHTLRYRNDTISMEIDSVNYFKVNNAIFNVKYKTKIYDYISNTYFDFFLYALFKQGKVVRVNFTIPHRGVSENIPAYYNSEGNNSKGLFDAELHITPFGIQGNETGIDITHLNALLLK